MKKAKITGTGVFLLSAILYFLALPLRKTTPNMKKQEKERTANEDLAKMIEEKASRPLLSANLRILVSADSQEKIG